MLVLGSNADDLRATCQTVEAALGKRDDPPGGSITGSVGGGAPAVTVVPLLHRDADGLTRGGEELALVEGPWPGCWALPGGTGEDAAVCGLDPTGGLVACLGFASCVLCIVGVAREPSLGGEDAAGSRCVRAARRAATIGIPTVACCVPTVSRAAPLDPACDALSLLLDAVARSLSSSPSASSSPSSSISPFSTSSSSPYSTTSSAAANGMTAAANCPRSHFPFPTKGRWAALGTPQLPVDDELAAQLVDPTEVAGDFAAADCWSLGGLGVVPHYDYGGGGGGDERVTMTPGELREVMRGAFAEGDAFLCLHVPPQWQAPHPPSPPPPLSPSSFPSSSSSSCSSSVAGIGETLSKAFTTSRPGVLWRQQRVQPITCQANQAETRDGKDEGAGRGGVGHGAGDGATGSDHAAQQHPTIDLWGRSLPVQTLGGEGGGSANASRKPSSEGARFVSQLATERMVAERQLAQGQWQCVGDETSRGRGQDWKCVVPPRGFVVSGGTVVADDSARGDVDAVMSGKAAVCALPTWPQGHAFALLDVVAVEALREDPASGLPLWLCER